MAQTKLPSSQQNETYSSSEQAVGTWVDGRTVYRKVLRGQFTAGTNTQILIPHGITGATNSFEVVAFQGGIKLGNASGSVGKTMQLPTFREAGGNWANPQQVDGTNIYYFTSFSWGNTFYSLILEYVK